MDVKQIEEEISQIYRTILFREVDDMGLHYWTKKIIDESYDIKDVKNEILNSTEFKNIKKDNHGLPEFKCKINESGIKKIIEKTSWYHSFNFNGILNKNTRTVPSEQLWIMKNIPKSFQGKSVIDVGCADGFFGFYAAQNKADKVVCGDFQPAGYEGFQTAKKIIDLDVEYRIVNLFKFKETEKFDNVFCFGLYYHLPDPVQSLRYLESITKETLYLAGPISNETEPVMYYYKPNELYSGDDSNWWIASPSCLIDIAKRIGFKKAELLDERPAEHWTIPLRDKKSKRTINKYGIFKFSK